MAVWNDSTALAQVGCALDMWEGKLRDSARLNASDCVAAAAELGVDYQDGFSEEFYPTGAPTPPPTQQRSVRCSSPRASRGRGKDRILVLLRPWVQRR